MYTLTNEMSAIGWAKEYEYMSHFVSSATVVKEGELIHDKPFGKGPFVDFEIIDVTLCGPPPCQKKVGEKSIVHAHTCEELFKKTKQLVVLTLPNGSKTRLMSGHFFKEVFSLEMFKITVISEEVSDAIVEQMFPDVYIENEQEISEMIEVMQKHRPTLLKKLDALIKKQMH